jgi:hypothetical protein
MQTLHRVLCGQRAFVDPSCLRVFMGLSGSSKHGSYLGVWAHVRSDVATVKFVLSLLHAILVIAAMAS